MSKSPGGSLVAPATFITLGGIMIYSSLKGIGITDVLAGVAGAQLNPKGSPKSDAGSTSFGGGGDFGSGSGGDWKMPPGGQPFKGPKAALLNSLAGTAQNTYHLTITATSNGGHVADSYHYRNEAFDASGSEADMHGFAQYVQDSYGNVITELIHNPGFAIKNGHVVTGSIVYAAVWAGHKDHVHVAAA